jgi:uncharacterized membrane protein YhaH (DUF805 family)
VARPQSDAALPFVANLLFGFEGRLKRLDYRLIRTLWYVTFFLAAAALRSAAMPFVASRPDPASLSLLLIGLIVLLGLIAWTTLAMQVKRWHDRGKSGLWSLVGFIPVIGPIWVFVELVWIEGTPGPNDYGPSPYGDPTAV